MTRADGFAVAECDHNGQLPARPADVRWVGIQTLHNVPIGEALMTFEAARAYAVTLLRIVLHFRARPGADNHDAYAVVHVTPDGWRPVMWAMPDGPNQHANISLTLTEGARP